MKRILCVFVLIIPFLCSSQTRIRVSGFSEYDAWTHMDPFYLNEPIADVDNFRPVEYEERVTHIKLSLDSPLMSYWIGIVGAKINFVKGWGNRKHINDGDEYFEYSFPMTPYQTKRDYIDYGVELYYGFPMSSLKPYLGFGGEFRIEQTTSSFIYIDNQTNASADPIASIPVDEHVERRFGYYAIFGLDYIVGRHFYVAPHLKLYFNEVEIDEKISVKNRTDNAQFRPGVEIGFIF
ncbi:MAG: hypothetical protein CMP56_04275 [Flavobacteriales bacterium]|jgi:hypothetical protein|nr:hypothetical protein [Flavobacteriales bacterium]